MSGEYVLVWLIIGAVAGWLAGMIVKGGDFGFVGDIIIGIIGAFVGGAILTMLGLTVGAGLIGVVATATLGAVALLALFRAARI